jgi:capsular polysaccharide transport system permease protein
MRRWLGLMKRRPVLAAAVLFLAASLVYWNLLAARRYVSEAHIVVDNLQGGGGGGAAPAGDLASLFTGAAPSRDIMLLRDYLHSPDILAKLDQKLDLRGHYTSSSDPFSRLVSRDVPFEWFLQHYRGRISAEIDELAGVLVVQAQAYDPKMAHAIASLLVAEGERFMNEMAQKLMREQVGYAEREVSESTQRLAQSRQAMVKFQNQHGLVSPTGTVESLAAVVARLESELSDLQARRHALDAYLAPRAPELVQINDQIRAVQAQLKAQQARLASAQGASLNTVAEEYDRLVLDATFQQDVYRTSLTALERARMDATRTLRKVSVVQQPTFPQYSAEPGRMYYSALFLIGTLCVFGIFQLLLMIVREHRD